jgi:hypothetical protein
LWVQGLLEIELEVELPRTVALGKIPVRIGESQTKLDDLQQINVTSQSLVLVVRRATKLADGPRDDARELRVLHSTAVATAAWYAATTEE